MTRAGEGQLSLFPPDPAPDPLLCWLWLAGTLGAGSQRAGAVLDAFGGAQEAWEARDTDAFAAAAGPAAVQRACLPDNTPEHYRAFARRCAARRIRILPYDDPDYPLAFSRISDMPLVLYCTGDPHWLNEPAAVGMVGTRKPTEYGLRAAEDIGRGLARVGAVIVSGLADGLDSAGHRAAVGENCPTIAVMGVPIDRTYPAANRELRRAIERRGCVISEYPPESEPVGAVGFLQRNASSRPSPGRWWWWRPRKRAAPCPPWATQSGTVSRCSPCRAAFFRPPRRGRMPFCGTDAQKRSVQRRIYLVHWDCRPQDRPRHPGRRPGP